jgi:dTDP-4-amino-4,6-dideoxygalactose transaminase
MLSYIRPVGESISTSQGKPIDAYAGYDTQLYGSGTMSLQQALSLAKEKAKQSADSNQAEVLLPAYACPDLISACVGAGVKAVLVDLESANSPFSSIETIKQQTNQNTVAIIFVNFLGISPEPSLFDAARELGLLIIEDRAQCFIAPEEATQLNGDYVIFSFGKGKPVSLLGGGALLIKTSNESPTAADPISEEQSPVKNAPEEQDSKLPWLIRLYNLIILPFFYNLLMKIPGLSIGETNYHAPEKIVSLDEGRRHLLSANIDKQYRTRSKQAQKELFTLCEHSSDIHALGNMKTTPGLLRFPILCDDITTRDRLVTILNKHGIGASKMYQTTLPNISSTPLSEAEHQKNYPNAQQFANRLLTLPCHSDVNATSLKKISEIFTKEFT